MESEKKAVRDFHAAINLEAKGEAFLPLRYDRPTPNMVGCGNNYLESSEDRKNEIPESDG